MQEEFSDVFSSPSSSKLVCGVQAVEPPAPPPTKSLSKHLRFRFSDLSFCHCQGFWLFLKFCSFLKKTFVHAQQLSEDCFPFFGGEGLFIVIVFWITTKGVPWRCINFYLVHGWPCFTALPGWPEATKFAMGIFVTMNQVLNKSQATKQANPVHRLAISYDLKQRIHKIAANYFIAHNFLFYHNKLFYDHILCFRRSTQNDFKLAFSLLLLSKL